MRVGCQEVTLVLISTPQPVVRSPLIPSSPRSLDSKPRTNKKKTPFFPQSTRSDRSATNSLRQPLRHYIASPSTASCPDWHSWYNGVLGYTSQFRYCKLWESLAWHTRLSQIETIQRMNSSKNFTVYQRFICFKWRPLHIETPDWVMYSYADAYNLLVIVLLSAIPIPCWRDGGSHISLAARHWQHRVVGFFPASAASVITKDARTVKPI